MGCGASASVGPEPLKVKSMPHFSPGTENFSSAPTAPSSVRENEPRRPVISFASAMLDGWATIYSVTESNIRTNAEKAKFFENFADLEKQYAQKLLKLVANTKSNLSKVPSHHKDVGTTGAAWEATLSSVEKLATQHAYVAETVERDVYRLLDKANAEYERRQKKIVNEGKRVQKEFKQTLDEHHKKKQSYMDAAKAADTAETNYNISKTDPGSSAKALQRHTESQVKLSGAERDYKSSVKDTNHRQNQHYVFQQPELLTNFENLEMERLSQLREASSNFANVMATLPPICTSSVSAVVSTTTALDPKEDIQTWLYANQTHKEAAPDFQYVSFKAGDTYSPPPPAEQAPEPIAVLVEEHSQPSPPVEDSKPEEQPPPPEPAPAELPEPVVEEPEPEPPKPEPPNLPEPKVEEPLAEPPAAGPPTHAPPEPAPAAPAEPVVQTVKLEMSFRGAEHLAQQASQPYPPGQFSQQYLPPQQPYPSPYQQQYVPQASYAQQPYPQQPFAPQPYPQQPYQQPYPAQYPPQPPQQWQPAHPSQHQQPPQPSLQQPPPPVQQPHVIEQVVELPRAPAAQPPPYRPSVPAVDSPRRARPEPVKVESPRQMTPRRLASLGAVGAPPVTTMTPPISSLRPLEVGSVQAPLVPAPIAQPAPAPVIQPLVMAPLPELNLPPLQLPMQFTSHADVAAT
eukprot:TRINITY_DN18319_c0_g1_i2.p1 TRINITY_DN18319_c0_g1~~TRINITY_DN18319_c0_g1_i2.p1  ORF type:complete len:684 (+),score=137.91 TRINITY_DN18319_c0_g1_i2:68-2119(+)